MSANKLGSQLAISATRSVSAINKEIRDALDALRGAAPSYVAEAEAITAKGAAYLEQGLAGQMDLEIAAEAALREAGALELLALQAVEVGAQEALRRTKKILDIAVSIGFQLIKAAML